MRRTRRPIWGLHAKHNDQGPSLYSKAFVAEYAFLLRQMGQRVDQIGQPSPLPSRVTLKAGQLGRKNSPKSIHFVVMAIRAARSCTWVIALASHVLL